MKNVKKVPLFYPIEVGGIKLKVFVVGGSPQIEKRAKIEMDPENMKGTHTHFTYEVFFVTAGHLQVVTGDFSKTYENEILIVPPRLRHYTMPDSDGSFCLLFAPEEGGRTEETLRARIGDGLCSLPLDDDVAFYIDRLARRRGESTPTAERDAELLIALIFNRILSRLLPSDTEPGFRASSAEHINVIENYINAHLSEKITLNDLSRQVYLSTKQVARIIERAYGCSLSELVTDKRLAIAEMMLKNTNMKIAEIASAFCASEAYFYVLFKKKYGISPLKYRKESRIFK